jgi:hypothetical protein
VTGQYAEITGYHTVRSGIDPFIQISNITGSLQVKEGDRYYKDFGDYIEQVGFLSGINNDTYSPTGQAAHATLGLQTGITSVSGVSISSSQPHTTINIPLYRIVYLTGHTKEVSSIVNTPIYQTIYETGGAVSGISYTGDIQGFTKDYIYYLGERSFI